MKFQWYRSATVGVFSDSGTSVLCDPWVTDGAFIGSWYHWPPLEGFELESLLETRWDAVYISHFHADHFDRRALAAILRRQGDVRVIIPQYSTSWLKRAVLNCGVAPSKLIEARNNTPVCFGDMNVTVFVADYCNPQICGASISCGTTPRRLVSNDSVALFEADGQRILNANDALAVQSVNRLWPWIGQVDLLLGHYGGAGPFPQCFTDLGDQEKLERARSTGWAFVNRLLSAADRLGARFTFPYAGQYVLGGSLSALNPFRSVIPMPEVLTTLAGSGVTTPISLAPFGTFDLSSEGTSREWEDPPLGTYERYLDKIKDVQFPYQGAAEDWGNGNDVLRRALGRVQQEFVAYISEGGTGSNSSITIDAGDVVGTIHFSRHECRISDDAYFDNQTRVSLDIRLLRRLIVRAPGYQGFTPYHFNQAEIGSHLFWSRTGPYVPETHFLNFMHTTDT